MKLINLKTKKGIVNLFADYILNNVDPSLNTIIQVTDFNHFIVINGVTESTSLLDLSEIKNKFISEYQSLLNEVGYGDNFSTMDLIQYNKKVTDSSYRYLWSTFYNSSRPIYHQEVLDKFENTGLDYISLDYSNGLLFELDYSSVIVPSKFNISPIQVTSEFPHGYSLSMGRLLFYYSEYIANQIIKTSSTDRMDILLSDRKNDDGDQIFDIKMESVVPTDFIKSMVLDIFDFDFTKFKSKLKSYDFCDDIKKPTEDKPWLVKDKDPIDLTLF